MDNTRIERIIGTARNAVDHFIEDAESGVGAFFTSLAARVRRVVRKPPKASAARHKKAANYVGNGRDHYNARRYAKAEQKFRRAISLDGRYALAHYYLGLSLYKSGRAKAARAAWKTAVEMEPGSDAAEKARRKLGSEKLGRDRMVKVAGVDSDSS